MKPNTTVYRLIIIFVFLAQIQLLKAQNDEEITWRDRLFFGGNVSFAVGSITIIQVSPLAGYRITPRWSAGFGVDYEYYKSSGQSYGYAQVKPYSTSIYGGNIFTNYVLVKNFPMEGISLLAQTEYEALSLEKKYFQDYTSSGRFILHSVFIGGGIRQRMGRRSSFNLLVLWNFNETQYSPYSSNPILKFNFIF
jgi:hypothetical protein